MEKRCGCMDSIYVKLTPFIVTDKFDAIFFHIWPVIALSKDLLCEHWTIHVATTGGIMCISYDFVGFIVCKTLEKFTIKSSPKKCAPDNDVFISHAT